MIESPRKTIRDQVVALLTAYTEDENGARTYATPAEARVFGNRTRPVPQDQMPAIAVMTPAEKVPPKSSPDGSQRELDLEVVVLHQDKAEDVQDYVDNLAWLVEGLISAPPCLGITTGLVNKVEYQGWRLATDADGRLLVGSALVLFTITYTRPPYQDLDELADFLMYHSDVDLPPRDGEPDLTIVATRPGYTPPEEPAPEEPAP